MKQISGVQYTTQHKNSADTQYRHSMNTMPKKSVKYKIWKY